MRKKSILLVALGLVLALPALAQEPGSAGGAGPAEGSSWGVIGAAFLLGIAAAAGRDRSGAGDLGGRGRDVAQSRAPPRTSAA